MNTYLYKEEEVREQFEYLLRISEVRNILGCGVNFVLQLIKDGEVDAFQINGKAVTRREIDQNSFSLRVSPSSLKNYLDRTEVK